MARTALITGASSGLGAEYARQLAARGERVILVARSEGALAAVADEIEAAQGERPEVLPADLLDDTDGDAGADTSASDAVAGGAGSRGAGLAAVVARLSDPARPVDTLVNNAGFGLPLAFERNDIEAEVAHLRLHDEVAMRLMHAALQGMLARGDGRIVNVASVAAFIPRSTYSASKRWLVMFSSWANERYRRRGVTVTAVCPGYTHTNFHERLGLPPGQEGVPRWMWLDAPAVVAASLRDADRGRSLSVPSLRYKILARLARVIPARLTSGLGERGR